jgi:hypothetical protein
MSNKRQVAGALYGRSTEMLMASCEFIGWPTMVNSLGPDGQLVMEPNTVKNVTRKYWSKLYKHQIVPEVLKQ